jgi:hypothetical protein
MGNKLSCSCGPLKIKGYRYDSKGEPWHAQVPFKYYISTFKGEGVQKAPNFAYVIYEWYLSMPRLPFGVIPVALDLQRAT